MLILSMMMCIRNLVSICLFVLKILGKNQILTSIKDRNSVANLRKTMIYITNVDLVNGYVNTKFGLNRSICFRHMNKNSILTLIKGRNSTPLQICLNSNSSKLSCMASLPARMKKIKLKIKVLDCSQDFSHYKSRDFSRCSREANFAVHGPIWSNFELVQEFMVVLLTCKNEEDPIKIEALECSQHYTSIFQTCKGR